MGKADLGPQAPNVDPSAESATREALPANGLGRSDQCAVGFTGKPYGTADAVHLASDPVGLYCIPAVDLDISLD